MPWLHWATVPVCSTVLLGKPSRPVQNAAAEFSLGPQLIEGCVQVEDTVWKEPG